ncbi:unnamed protein product [Soboliphyme baturini]|uniref:MFS domain-containing protein n=1 Tax=Soboliphyme baturini TaxID=241478 RepID=A0A183IL98_9BILA|nr:unnamed protein product [Soboliphyme baturini]
MASDDEPEQSNAMVDGVVATFIQPADCLFDRWFPTSVDPRKATCRYFVLALICFLNFGNYMVYDTPAALSDNIVQDMEVSSSSYNLLYDIYSWPNVILAFFAGVLIDNVCGIRLGGVIFSFIVMSAQIIVAVGAFTNAFWLMVVGRGIFA